MLRKEFGYVKAVALLREHMPPLPLRVREGKITKEDIRKTISGLFEDVLC